MSTTCVTFALLIGTLNLSSVHLPGLDESLLGAHVFNLTCDSIQLDGLAAHWTNDSAYAGTSGYGRMDCHANLTAYAYSGVVRASVLVSPSEVRLGLRPLDDVRCRMEMTVQSCAIQASIASLVADPPSPLIDLLLGRMRAYINDSIQPYVCSVWVPQLQEKMGYPPDPPPFRETTGVRSVVPLYSCPVVAAAASVFERASLPGLASQSKFFSTESLLLRAETRQRTLHIHTNIAEASEDITALQWAQKLVDYVVNGSVPWVFPVYHFPGSLSKISLDATLPTLHLGSIMNVTLAGGDANSCEVYLNPGVEVALASATGGDSFVNLIAWEVFPRMAAGLNALAASTLAAVADAQQPQRNASDGDATAELSFAKKATVRRTPLAAPLVSIVLLALVGGVWLVRRNLHLHTMQPVRMTHSGEPAAAWRIAAEDTVMIGGAAVCMLFFASSNTMTGASVLLGGTTDMYAFSLWNTVADLWNAGLIPLSICVFVFSGVYPYVKLLSLVYFTVWAQRPLSRRLALIDVVGKFSFIDTFALMVMVSGLEISNVARVQILPAFYFFMYATVASIALGNYATSFYRRGTSSRVEEQSSGDPQPESAYVQVATEESGVAADVAAEAVQPLRETWWSRMCNAVALWPLLLMLLCSAPAWMWSCLQYDIGGLARLLTPTQKRLSLWQLSNLNRSIDRASDGATTGIFIVAIVTILIAPCLYVGLRVRRTFLASWCSADVFAIACVAGLLQLHQFIAFVLGDGMDEVYSARATLRWPMAFLAVAAHVIWVFVLRDVAGLRWPLKRHTTTVASP